MGRWRVLKPLDAFQPARRFLSGSAAVIESGGRRHRVYSADNGDAVCAS
jgi:hypothetical protein